MTSITKRVYTFIKEESYIDAIEILRENLIKFPTSHQGFSLLGYCFYKLKDYHAASDSYKISSQLEPESVNYSLNYAQSLYMADQCSLALTVLAGITVTEENQERLNKLKLAISYKNQNFENLENLLSCYSSNNTINGCVKYLKSEFDLALEKFSQQLKSSPNNRQLSYNVALCYYRLGMFENSLQTVNELFEDSPPHEDLDVTHLVELCNLKAAILFEQGHEDASMSALSEIPYTSEDQLDSITLHNKAILESRENLDDSLKRLQFLLQSSNYTNETLRSLIILLLQKGEYDLLSNYMLQYNKKGYNKYLDVHIKEMVEGIVLSRKSPEDGYNYFETLVKKYYEKVKRFKRKMSTQSELVNRVEDHFDHYLAIYSQFVMQQTKILWDIQHYNLVEKVLESHGDFLSKDYAWQINYANSIFMQPNRFKTALSLYSQIVDKAEGCLTDLDPVLVANYCVTLIMTDDNARAEMVMQRVEEEEDRHLVEDHEKKMVHSCIINLIIGTLYCVKGNYDFGISRIIKSFRPLNARLTSYTWLKAKRPFMTMAEGLASGFLLVQHKVILDALHFLEECEDFFSTSRHPEGGQLVREVRLIQRLLLKLVDVKG